MVIMQSCFSVLHYCLIAVLSLKDCLIYTIAQILESAVASFMMNPLLFPSLSCTGGSSRVALILESTGGFFCLPVFGPEMSKFNLVSPHQSYHCGC